MDAKELRIGNWYNFEGEPMKLDWDDFRNTEFDYIDSRYEPIPITEEWLIGFEFELDEDLGDQIYYKRGKWIVCFDHEDLSFNHQLTSGITCLLYDNPCFQHVHQLQNLYFALTGKELTYERR